jgi:hypothetical protein
VSDGEGVVDVVSPPDVTAMLDGVGCDLGATYFMMRLALFTALIGLETRIQDQVIDTYLTLRGRGELRGMFGPLMNRAVLRVRFSGETSLERWVAEVRSEIVDLSRHGWIPFELLMRHLRQRGVDRPPLGVRFQIDEEPAPVSFDGLRVEPLPRDPVHPWAFRLMVKRVQSGERWQAVFDPGLHDPSGVEGFLIRMRALAVSGCAEPARALSELHAATLRAPFGEGRDVAMRSAEGAVGSGD